MGQLLDELEGSLDIEVFRSQTNLGPGAGRNMALAQISTRFDYVAMFDNDIVALPGWDEAALCAFNSGTDLLQPKLLEADGRTVERGPNTVNNSALAANPQFLGRGVATDHAAVNHEDEVAIVGGTCIVRRSVFDRIGMFDERFQIAEDYDFSFRAKAAGLTLRYVPTCALIHDHVFNIVYDQQRSQVEKYLITHVLFWRKWGKALLSPEYLSWFSWLELHKEPMYLDPDSRWSIFHRRIRRRLMRQWTMSRYGTDWASAEMADKATEALAARLGI